MHHKSFWVSRAVGGVVAGVVIAGAGVGVAEAGAAGSSDQYTHGAKPYAGVAAHQASAAAVSASAAKLLNARVASASVRNGKVVTGAVTTPYTTTSTLEAEELAAAVADLKVDATAITALLKPDLRTLLEPSGNYLKTSVLAKAKTVSFAFASTGSGKLSVVWKASVKGRKSVDYVNYSGTLRKVGSITVKLPTTTAGRKLLTRATNGAVAAVVTYTPTGAASVKVTRSYKLVG
jgi:hypothetical protein